MGFMKVIEGTNKMNYKRILAYTMAFCISTTLVFLGFVLFWGFVIAALTFVTWTLPVGVPFTWGIFRLLLTFAVSITILFLFTKEGKKFITGIEKDL